MKRVAVVSGGADGIGKEVVLEFLDAGFAVAAFDINDEKLAKVSEELKDRDFIGIHCNAIEEESVQKAFSQVMGALWQGRCVGQYCRRVAGNFPAGR